MKNLLKKMIVSALLVTCMVGGTVQAQRCTTELRGSDPETVYGALSYLTVGCSTYSVSGADFFNTSGSKRYLWVNAVVYDSSGKVLDSVTNNGAKVDGAGMSAYSSIHKTAARTIGTGKIYKGTTSGSGVAETLTKTVKQ